jgi:integrase
MNIHYRETRPGHFQVYFWDKSKRIFLQRDSLGEPLRNMQQVKSVIADLEGNGYDPRYWTFKIPFDKTVREWMKLSNCSPDWQRKKEKIIEGLFIPYFKKSDCLQINDGSIEGFYKTLQGKSKKTQKNYLDLLKSFFRWMVTKKIIAEMPQFPKIRYIPDYDPHTYSKEEQEKVFEFAPGADKDILTFLRWTGARPSEARGLIKSDVDWVEGKIYIRHALSMGGKLKGTKTGLPKTYPIFPEIEECLKSDGHPTFVFCKHGRPYSRRMLEKAWKRMVKAAHERYGTPIYPLYQGTKHSLGNQMINEEGRSPSEVQQVFGHSDLRSTLRYSRINTRRLNEIMGDRSRSVHTKKTQQNQGKLAGVGGFEPPSPGSKDLCLTA